tara:strand:- start:1355 stop:3412 length:2058 start_codon:yes stop_codon:yes gene_type:complete
MRPKILYKLFSNLETIKGIGPKNAKLIERLCGKYLLDLILHRPIAYIDRRNSPKIKDLSNNSIVTLILKVDGHTPSFNKRMPYKITCSDDTGQLNIVYFNLRGPYLKKMFPIGSKKVVSGKVEEFNGIFQMTHPQHIADESNLDSVKKIECVYPLTAGISSKIIQKSINSSLAIIDDLPEWIPNDYLQKNNWTSWKKSIYEMHNPNELKEDKEDIYLNRLVFDELLSQQLTVRLIKNKISKLKGNTIKPNGSLLEQLKSHLSFELTDDQNQAIKEISKDQSSPNKMLRLIQGDVGSGKTIVALHSMIQCAENSKKSILMAPTEILAEQHYNTIKLFAEKLKLSCALITASNKKNHNYESDILIGTHALFQDKVSIDNIGLIVIDEQHRFGVHQRILLNEKAGNECDILLMTATPIPRTLELASYGDMDITKIVQKPKNRKPIITKSINLNKIESLKEALTKKLKQQEKIYWVCPLVDESDKMDLQSVNQRVLDIQKYYKDFNVEMVHGQMKQEEKNKIMDNFKSFKTQILVATSVIEVGIDDPDATVIIIENSERFGLSQLHQLRGRVGRGTKQSTCILLFDGPLTENAKKRINVMKETNDGFKIAEEDLSIRGAGEILGTRQSGLPNFRLTDLNVHKSLMAQAREMAIKIVDKDPELSSDQGKSLRLLLHLFNNQVAIDYLKSG